jgi:radical SAM superfamily enzyme YgiQ (UPF0313 family)
MNYEGPIYRPPSEADSLLIQATVGCPHNKCTFCMVYKKGPAYRVRRVKDIKADLDEAELVYGSRVKSLFFPAGNTIAMPADQLAEICAYGRSVFPELQRITIYGSSRYIVEKGPDAMRMLRESGLSRIHVGFESGDDEVLRRIKKGADAATQIQAGIWVREAGIELSEYIMLGIGGTARSSEHALRTAEALNKINPDFIRLRTFLPKIDTLLLHQIQKGRFQMLSAHQVLREAKLLLKHLDVTSDILSDHYTNYADVHGKLPVDRDRMLRLLETCLNREESSFRSVYIGTQ